MLRQRDQKPSNKRLISCFLYLREKLETLSRTKTWEWIIRGITDAIQTKLIVIQIKVTDVADAYLLFETLNDRGLALSVADLLKNHLFSKAGDDRASDIQENWDEMVAILGAQPVRTFLRHYWLSTNGVVRDKELFREMKAKYSTSHAVLNLSKQLVGSSDFYSAFSDPNHTLWSVFDPNIQDRIRNHLEEINLFGVSQYHPLMLATVENNEGIFADVLKLISIFSFRYSVICQKGTGNIERAVSDAAIYVRNDRQATATKIFEKLTNLYPKDDEFAEFFQRKIVTESAVARYILIKINDYQTQLRHGAALVTNQNPRQENLEHILPKKFNADGSDWLPAFNNSVEDADQCLHRLGNMTLLPARINRNISNAAFGVKRDRGYSQNPLVITEPILTTEIWGRQQIEERQRQFSTLAKAIWRLDF